MKKYTSPIANIVAFESADIITSSGFITLSWGSFKESAVPDEAGFLD